MKPRSVLVPGDVLALIEELRNVNGYTIAKAEVIRKAITDLYQKEKGQENGQA